MTVARSVYATGAFWQATGERAVKSGAQALLVAFGATTFNLWSADWQQIAGAALAMMGASVATSLASANLNGEGPSITGAETTAPACPGGEVIGAATAAIEANGEPVGTVTVPVVAHPVTDPAALPTFDPAPPAEPVTGSKHDATYHGGDGPA